MQVNEKIESALRIRLPLRMRLSKQRKSKRRKIAAFDWVVLAFLIFVFLITFIPLWYVVIISLTPLQLTKSAGYNLFLPPTQWSFGAYLQMLSQNAFLQALLNSVILTVSGVAVSLVLTTLTAYALTFKDLPGRNFFLTLIIFTFLFNPGLIPTYLVVKNLNLLDNYLAIILPPAINVYYLLLMKVFFQNIPASLRESALIDGANELQVLWRVILPLCKPILLTIGLFYAVYLWNDYFYPILYLSDPNLTPLPLLLYNILTSNGANGINAYVETNALYTVPQEALKMAAVILSMIPMLFIYPWIQRYFTKGVLLGSIKE